MSVCKIYVLLVFVLYIYFFYCTVCVSHSPPPASQAGFPLKIGNRAFPLVKGRTTRHEDEVSRAYETSNVPRCSFTTWMGCTITLSRFPAIIGTTTDNLGNPLSLLRLPPIFNRDGLFLCSPANHMNSNIKLDTSTYHIRHKETEVK